MAKREGDLRNQILDSSETTFDIICEPCHIHDNTIKEAIGFCVDCSEFLCSECHGFHLKPPLTRYHQLIGIEEAENTIIVRDICQEKCAEHPEKVVEYYCSDHDLLGCTVCMTLEHRSCLGAKYIPKICQEAANSEEYCTLINSLETLILQAKCLRKSSNHHKIKSKETGKNALDQFQKLRKEIIGILDKVEKEMEFEIEERTSKDATTMDANIIACESAQTNAEKIKKDLQRMKDKNKYCTLFVAMKRNKNAAIPITEQIDQVSAQNSIKDFLFRPSSQLENFVKYKGRHGILTETVHTNTTTNVKYEAKINVKTDCDSELCAIYGITKVKTEILCVVDYSNKKVKMIDAVRFGIISEYKTSSRPWNIATNGYDDILAVTLYEENTILLLKINGRLLSKDIEIATGGSCYGIACVEDNFVVGLVRPERVEIIDRHGTVIKTIRNDELGRNLFSDIRGVAFDTRRSCIYICDCSSMRLTRMSLSGSIQNIYQGSCLDGARQIEIGKNGYLYVGSSKTNTVHIFDQECQLIGEMLLKKGSLLSFRSCYFCDKTDQLYIGQSDLGIKVYKVSTNTNIIG